MLLECVNSSNNKLCCQVLLLLFFLFCCYCRCCLKLIIDRHAWRKRRAASAAGQAAVAFQNRVPKLSGRCVARERERAREVWRERGRAVWALATQSNSEAPGSVLHAAAATDTNTFTPTDTATISVIHIRFPPSCEHAKCNYKSRQMWINFCFESQPATGSGSRGVWVTCVYAICLDEAKLIELTFGNARNHANL